MKNLNESLDAPYKWKWSFKTETITADDEDDGEPRVQSAPREYEVLSPVQIVRFQTDAGVPYVWYARQNYHDNTRWEIAFGEFKETGHGGALILNTDKTGKGDAFRVFATVIDITNAFIEYDSDGESGPEVHTLTFTSKGDNRTRLYVNRMVPRIDKFKLDTSERTPGLDGESSVTLSRTESAPGSISRSLIDSL